MGVAALGEPRTAGCLEECGSQMWPRMGTLVPWAPVAGAVAAAPEHRSAAAAPITTLGAPVEEGVPGDVVAKEPRAELVEVRLWAC